METVSRPLLTFLLNALWQIPIVALISALLCRMMRNGPARHRHAIAVTALIASLALPLASIRTSEPGAPMELTVNLAPQPGVAMPVAAAKTVAVPARTPNPDRRAVSFPRMFAALALWAYGLFLVFRVVLLVRAWVRTERIRDSAGARELPPAVERVWTRCLNVFGVKGVELSFSKEIPSPITAGVRRRDIVLPEAMRAETSQDVLTTAIGHEMAHVARRDFGFSLFYELLYVPVSFHPAAWVIRRAIEQTREMACDELVTSKLMDAGAYARSIVNIAAAMTALENAGYTLGVFDGNILEDRIRRLLERPAANLRRARLLLATGLGTLAVSAVIASGLAVSARAQGGVHNELKIAESAYNAGDFTTAAQHFEHAVELAPSNLKAKLFLANALLSQYFGQPRQPDSPLIAQARQQYQDVLASDSSDKQALQGMVTIAMQTGHAADAHPYAIKLTEVDPQDKTTFYTVGVLDWATVYPELGRAKAASGGKPEDYAISDATLRKNFRDQYQPVVEEGMKMLDKALALDPAYGDAMAYMNLLYRLKAAMADNPADAARLIATADQWVGKALAVRKQTAALKPAPPAPLNVDGPAPGPASGRGMVAAPPPPPPPPGRAMLAHDRPASAAPPPASTAPSAGQYWQVMGSNKSTPAIAMFRELRQKGFPAAMLAASDNVVRVMVGPFFDDASAQRAKTELEKEGYQPLRLQ
jgi:beta-lactamase regulating signal transducer with metallopeptidase domain/cell division septation protein DedD